MDRRIAFVLAALGILAVLLPVLMIGCSQDTDAVEVFNIFSGADCTSPVLVSTESGSGNVVRLVFSEPVRIYGASLGQYPARAEGKNVYVTLPRTLGPGMQADLEGRVKDYAGNSSGFSVRVWGYNPEVPDILINEFTTKGTARSPDRTELLVLGDGNLNGAVLYAGTPVDYDAKFVFGDIPVKKGDFITVWWTEDFPQGSSPGAADFCAFCSDGLSSNNGALVLCRMFDIGGGSAYNIIVQSSMFLKGVYHETTNNKTEHGPLPSACDAGSGHGIYAWPYEPVLCCGRRRCSRRIHMEL